MRRIQRLIDSFSLVEIVIAIGVLSFVIFGVVGLVPAGLKVFRNSNQQSGAANLLNALADSVRSAVTEDGTNFFWIYNGETNSYTISGPASTKRWEGANGLSIQGLRSANTLDKQLLAAVVVTPPASPWKEGAALISVAWPAASGAVWDASTSQWSHTEGSATLGIRFLPRRSLP